MRKNSKLLLALLLLLISCRIAIAQAKNVNPVFKQWTIDDGLPQNSITGILQSYDDYIWLTTFAGMVQFDGVNFNIFNRFNSPGLLTDRIVSITQDSHKRLWIGTEEDLSCLDRGRFKTYNSSNGLPKGEISNVFIDYKERLWLKIINQSLHYLQNGIIKKFSSLNISASTAFGLTLDKHLLIVNNEKLYRLDGDSLIVLASTKGIINKTIIGITSDKKGGYWIATTGEGVFNYANNKFTRYLISNNILDNSVNDVYCDSDSRIWITTNNGLAYFNGSKFILITKENGFPIQGALRIIQDKEGNYWIGTITGGLIRMRNSLFQTYSSADGLSVDNLLSICELKDGSLLFGSNCGGLHTLKNGIVSNSNLTKHLKNSCVWSVIEQKDGTIWVGSDGITLFNGNKIRTITDKNGLVDNLILSMYEDTEGNVWVGTGGGLTCFKGNEFKKYTTANGLSNNQVRCMLEDSRQTLWVGTLHGLNKIENGKITSVKIPGLNVDYFRSILETHDGSLWFGTYEGGLIRYKNNKFTIITTMNGLYDNMISHLLEDNYGYFWIGCNRGIFRVDENELNSVADGKSKWVNSYVYSKTDGMLNIETNGGFQPSAIKLKNGRLCFPTVKGLAIVNPADVKINRIIPAVHIENIIIDSKRNKINPYMEIDYTQANFEIKYTALSFIDPAKVRFKYQMEGIDKGWIDAGPMRSVYYTNVSPGEHRFKVIACNNDGIWNASGASFTIYVVPPFWRTWWFRLLSTLLFFLLVYLYYRRRVARITRMQKIQQEFSRTLIDREEQDRKRIAIELHDSIGQELLVIKNRALMGLQKPEETEKTNRQLELISQTASKAIDTVRTISHNLRPPELDKLGLTAALEDIIETLAESSSIIFNHEIDNIDGLIPAELEINLVRIVQESFNNIIKHAGATQADFYIKRSDKYINVTIADNGKGFEIEKSKTGLYSGIGLLGMEERIKMLNGKLNVNSNPEDGTRITIEIPIMTKSN